MESIANVMGGPGMGPTPNLRWCTVTVIAGDRSPMTLWSTSAHAAEGSTYAFLTRTRGIQPGAIRWGYQPTHPLAVRRYEG
jgi:hypothetical protein